jgi:hypothetical protein
VTVGDLVPIPVDATDIEGAADPAQYVIQGCERAKVWLAHVLEHGDIEQIVELKSQAEAIRVYTMSKQLGRDAELSAAEIVRRAERGIGLAIRKGQASGQIRSGQDTRFVGPGRHGDFDRSPISPKTYLPGTTEAVATYAMTDNVSDEQFETALGKAKADGNLSRANVVRTVQAVTTGNHTTRPRRPITDAFRDASYDLVKAAEKVSRLAADDRFPKNAEQVGRTCRHDLLRAADLLSTVIELFSPTTQEGTE